MLTLLAMEKPWTMRGAAEVVLIMQAAGTRGVGEETGTGEKGMAHLSIVPKS